MLKTGPNYIKIDYFLKEKVICKRCIPEVDTTFTISIRNTQCALMEFLTSNNYSHTKVSTLSIYRDIALFQTLRRKNIFDVRYYIIMLVAKAAECPNYIIIKRKPLFI